MARVSESGTPHNGGEQAGTDGQTPQGVHEPRRSGLTRRGALLAAGGLSAGILGGIVSSRSSLAGRSVASNPAASPTPTASPDANSSPNSAGPGGNANWPSVPLERFETTMLTTARITVQELGGSPVASGLLFATPFTSTYSATIYDAVGFPVWIAPPGSACSAICTNSNSPIAARL